MRNSAAAGAARSGRAAAPRRRLALAGTLSLLALQLPLAGCDPTQSYEVASNGSAVQLDQMSDAARAAARRNIVESLRRGVAVYDLGIGDAVEIFFHVSRKPTARPYVIAPADKLRVSFLGDSQNDQTIVVPPDGRISLPLIGSVTAAGQAPDALARELERRYSGLLPEPKITVSVSETHTRVEDFIDVVSSNSKGRSITDKVLPDGTIALPLLPPLKAVGRPLAALEGEIDAAYAAKGLGVRVSLVPRTLHSNTTLVIGEVGKPGQVQLYQPTTVLMAVAEAGGATKTGAMSAVRVYYIGNDGVQRVRSINLDAEMDDLTLEYDMIVPPNSIIYVPPTQLAKAGRFLDTVLRDILQYQGLTMFASFQISPPTQNQGITILQAPASK